MKDRLFQYTDSFSHSQVGKFKKIFSKMSIYLTFGKKMSTLELDKRHIHLVLR